MPVLNAQSQKQSVHRSKKAFSLMLSALFLTGVLSSSAISFAQAAAQKTGGAMACSAAEDQQSGARQCTQSNAKSEAKAITIYSNLGPAKKLFNPTEGLAISGPESQPGTQAVGFPFTPTANLNLEGIELPAGWYGGMNSVDVCIYSDSFGLPGVRVECVTIYNLYPFGGGFLYPNCIWELPHPFYPWPCTCLNVWEWDPFALTAGTRYWVVVYPDPNEPDFWGYWYYNYKLEKGPIASYTDATGWQATEGILPAVALYGK